MDSGRHCVVKNIKLQFKSTGSGGRQNNQSNEFFKGDYPHVATGSSVPSGDGTRTGIFEKLKRLVRGVSLALRPFLCIPGLDQRLTSYWGMEQRKKKK